MTRHKPNKPTAANSGERLQKVLSRCGVGSRRSAEELITQGRIDVNGKTVTELGVRVDPLVDEIRMDGERLKMPDQRLVMVLNKPVGFLSAASDPEGRPLVYHLMPKGLALRSIGRLDFNTEGVLLFTNDGDLAERLGHARYNIQRVYEARVRGIPSEDTLAKLRMGVRLEDGPARAEQVEIVKRTDSNAWLRLTLIEGRNREVRRLLERVGHPVVRLRRVSFAGVTVMDCKQGEYRVLDEVAVDQLMTRGHVGSFDLPPDPRRKPERPVGLSTGPAPERTTPRRGEGRGEAVVVERPRKAAPGKPKVATGAPPVEAERSKRYQPPKVRVDDLPPAKKERSRRSPRAPSGGGAPGGRPAASGGARGGRPGGRSSGRPSDGPAKSR